jgi:hypothetical protein
MYDPFAAKNPFLSMWLSAVNAWLGVGRGLWMAEWQRQQAAMMQEATEQMIRFWTGGWMLPFTSQFSDRGKWGR